MDSWAGVVLAAGQGARMKSKLPKPLHRVCGRELLLYPVETMRRAGIQRIVVVVSPAVCGAVRGLLGDSVEYVTQPRANGTGDALERTRELLEGQVENLLVMNGDTPLVRPRVHQGIDRVLPGKFGVPGPADGPRPRNRGHGHRGPGRRRPAAGSAGSARRRTRPSFPGGSQRRRLLLPGVPAVGKPGTHRPCLQRGKAPDYPGSPGVGPGGKGDRGRRVRPVGNSWGQQPRPACPSGKGDGPPHPGRLGCWPASPSATRTRCISTPA